jgi:hypothetical protein
MSFVNSANQQRPSYEGLNKFLSSLAFKTKPLETIQKKIIRDDYYSEGAMKKSNSMLALKKQSKSSKLVINDFEPDIVIKMKQNKEYKKSRVSQD